MPADSNNVNSGARASGTVDWSRPIEAVHEDGRVVPVTLGRRDETMNSSIFVNGYNQRVHFDGMEDWAADWGGLHLMRPWRIRNVQPTTPELDPALWDRMVAFVRRVAGGFHLPHVNDKGIPHWEAVEQARAIVADLPKPVNPDLIEARKIAACDGFYEGTRETVERGEHDEAWPVRIALAALSPQGLDARHQCGCEADPIDGLDYVCDRHLREGGSPLETQGLDAKEGGK